jgi:hypothetical protein
MGNMKAARPYLEKALKIFENTLGKDHPTTIIIVRNNLKSIEKKDSPGR